MTPEGQDPFGRMAGQAMAVLETIAVIVLGALCGYAVYADDTLLAIVFGIGSLTFVRDLWRRSRTSRL